MHNCLCKALSAPNRACTAVPDKDIIHAVTRENRGLWSVCIGILKCRERIVIQFTDFKSGNYHRGLSSNFRVGSNQIPLCSSQKRKAAYIPRKIEAASVRVQICSRKIPDTLPLVAMLYKVTFQTVPKSTDCVQWWFCVLVTSDKKQDGSRIVHFYAFPICGDSLISCCQSAYFPGICI